MGFPSFPNGRSEKHVAWAEAASVGLGPRRSTAHTPKMLFQAGLAALLHLGGRSLGLGLALAAVFNPTRSVQDEAELEAFLARERAEASLLLRRGKASAARSALDEHLRDDPDDYRSRRLRAQVRLARSEWDKAERDLERSLAGAREAQDGEATAAAARDLVSLHLARGRVSRAQKVLDGTAAELDPSREPRDAWVIGTALAEGGDREGARRVFEAVVGSSDDQPWPALLARARCERALGRLALASQTLVTADRVASQVEGVEPDILVELGSIYFESEQEVQAAGQRSANDLFVEALEIAPGHEGALLGRYALHRVNFKRQQRSAESLLEELLEARPDSIEGRIVQVSSALEDGQLVRAREGLERLDRLAPERREVRSLHASLAWIEHRREDCEAILSELARRAPGDARPEREVGRHLNELYRFGEARAFLDRAVTRDPTDFEAWKELGRSLANVGREEEGLEALQKAKLAAQGRRDVWRDNMILVLERIRDEHVTEEHADLAFSWRADGAEILRTYLVPFYSEARQELAARYGFTPPPTLIEVFRRFQDFSVRSVGYGGFPALGVCFGPVVTSVSPLSRMRGNFSWARTSYHEFTHVIHLGLSHNRCPRWITEGLATWEEERRRPSWTRNMRRDLVDAWANEDLIPLRELNRAFRGPRILFGYYQGGLLCEMLIDAFDFPPMIRLLEAFDRGLDLDQAFAEVFELEPEEVDQRFRTFVEDKVGALAVEPRWSAATLAELRFALPREVPEDEAAREAWVQDMCTLAWGSWQDGRLVDAQEALRRLRAAGVQPHRALFLRGEIALHEGRREDAREEWSQAVEAGGRSFRALIGLGALAREGGDQAQAERYFLLAEEAFPGFDDPALAAELRLAEYYRERGEEGDDGLAFAAIERWLDWNSGEYRRRIEVADWHLENGRAERAAELYEEANEIDPFRRTMHASWGRALRELGRTEEALREFGVAASVPPRLEGEPDPRIESAHNEIGGNEALNDLRGTHPFELGPDDLARMKPRMQALILDLRADEAAERAELLASQAELLEALDRPEEARAVREEASQLELEAERDRLRRGEILGESVR